METRKFRGAGPELSLLGFGCMRLPKIDPDKPNIQEIQAQELIDYAYEHGVNYYDTAWPYHQGLSETFIGKALKKYPRDSFHLVSKMPGWECKTPEDAAYIFERQLEKCQVEYFDFYLAHAMNAERLASYKEHGVFDVLLQKKKEGKIRHLGFSFHDSPEVLRQVVDLGIWEFGQIQLNYLDWTMQRAKEQYEILQSAGLPVVVMEPVRGGALHTLCPQAVELLKKADPAASPASWALRFAASLPGVMTVLSGMSALDQVKDNVKTMEQFKPLTDADRALLQQAADIYQQSKTVPCTGCRYCMDCPSGVDIPLLFSLYNQYMLTEDKETFVKGYSEAGDSKQAQHCIACRACTHHCPQGIDIPAKIAGVKELADKLLPKE